YCFAVLYSHVLCLNEIVVNSRANVDIVFYITMIFANYFFFTCPSPANAKKQSGEIQDFRIASSYFPSIG
ncbi:MAG: hypothetical protein LBD80_03590, partial [Tannerella sp.]|nr:hypothetical protein [Tannerella sp.]